MSKIQLTLPGAEIAVTGKQVTFAAPCGCDAATALVIDGKEYAIVNALGQTIAGINGFWKAGAIVTVVLDVEKSKAYVQNAAVTPDCIGAANKSQEFTAIISASGWNENTYILAVNGVTTTTNQEILPALNIAAEQLEALQSANIQDGGQSAGSVTLKAFGDVPTIDIPIRVIVRGDM